MKLKCFHNLSARRDSRKSETDMKGFTLIELLVVIAIICRRSRRQRQGQKTSPALTTCDRPALPTRCIWGIMENLLPMTQAASGLRIF
jgi:prepilin-type N-terminal cleavage/methylation domain-containing protein